MQGSVVNVALILRKKEDVPVKKDKSIYIVAVIFLVLGFVIGVLVNNAERILVSVNDIQSDTEMPSDTQVIQDDEEFLEPAAEKNVSETETEVLQEDVSEQLLQRIESSANGKSVCAITTDYDADGTTEVFSIIGSSDGDDMFGDVYTGEIWFANPHEVYRIRENDTYYANSVEI